MVTFHFYEAAPAFVHPQSVPTCTFASVRMCHVLWVSLQALWPTGKQSGQGKMKFGFILALVSQQWAKTSGV